MVKSNPPLNQGNDHSNARRRELLRARFRDLHGARQRSLLGLPETLGLVASGLLLLTAVAAYFLMLAPARARLTENEDERQRLQSRLSASTEGVKRGANAQATADEIVVSLENFEANHLASLRSEGSTALIEELNRLIRSNNLSITTSISFTQLDEADAGQSARRQRSPSTGGTVRAVQNVFPGIGISLTVEGAYPNLRRFIRDVEADRQFIVINAVELEGVTGSITSRAPGTSGGALVSLRLDMAAYYRRTNASIEVAPSSTEGTR